MKKLLLIALCVCFALTAVAKDAPEKPIVPKLVLADLDHWELDDTCDEAQYNIITVDDNYSGAIDPAGDLDYYEVFYPAGGQVTFETSPGADPAVGDTQMTLFADDCATQVAYNDDGGSGLYSMFTVDLAPNTTYYLMINEYGNDGTGNYVVSATAPTPPPANDTCDGAIPLSEIGETYFEVDLCEYYNDYSPSSGGCTGYTANGPDAVYSMELFAGDEVFVSMDAVEGYVDLAIYLVTDCADIDGSCVAGDDSGNPEEIVYTAEADGTYYLILDTYSGCGLVGVTTNDVVAVEGATWSQVKSMYR